jgi:TetR/AcrR family transcriptional repressor of lmrAB and yxaGH operons
MASARDQIIETTCELIEMQGYHATGLNQIIKESGSPKGSLYYYFPGGKDELTAEAIKYTGETVYQRIKQNLAQIDDPAEAVRNFIHLLAHHVELSGFRAGGPITTVALETATTNERLSNECGAMYRRWQSAFIEKFQADGFPQERAERLASIIISSIEGGIILSRTFKNVKPLEDVAEELALVIKAKS